MIGQFFQGFDRGAQVVRSGTEAKQRGTQLDLNERLARVQERSQDRADELQPLERRKAILEQDAISLKLKQAQLSAEEEAANRIQRAQGVAMRTQKFQEYINSGLDYKDAFIKATAETIHKTDPGNQQAIDFAQRLMFMNEGGGKVGVDDANRKITPIDISRATAFVKDADEEIDADKAMMFLEQAKRIDPSIANTPGFRATLKTNRARQRGLDEEQTQLKSELSAINKEKTELANKISRGAFTLSSKRRQDQFRSILDRKNSLENQLREIDATLEFEDRSDATLLGELERLYTDGVISNAEFMEQRKALLNGNP